MIKLGMIGFSDGNGHPYSWSAIFNGYDQEKMENCGFPVIPRYLEKRKMPKECIAGARVTHIWTQDVELSHKIAEASLIENICEDLHQMVSEVDAFLLARDDWESHLEIGIELLKSGKPVYIDKPIAVNLSSLKALEQHQEFSGQIFSCSAFRFSEELMNLAKVYGKHVDAIFCKIPKSWEKYSVHLIDPVVGLFCERANILSVSSQHSQNISQTIVLWDNKLQTSFITTGDLLSRFSFEIVGDGFCEEISSIDTFSAFKNSLEFFIKKIQSGRFINEFTHHEKVVRIIESGLS